MKKLIALFLTTFAISQAFSGNDLKSTSSANTSACHIRLANSEESQYGLVIEFTSIEAFHDDKGWIVLNDCQQTISSYSFSEGNESVVANTLIPEGRYSKLRFTFGSNNSIYRIDDENRIPKKLDFEANHSRKVVVLIDEYIAENSTSEIKIDFNISNSVKLSNNQYILSPDLDVIEDPSKVTNESVTEIKKSKKYHFHRFNGIRVRRMH